MLLIEVMSMHYLQLDQIRQQALHELGAFFERSRLLDTTPVSVMKGAPRQPGQPPLE